MCDASLIHMYTAKNCCNTLLKWATNWCKWRGPLENISLVKNFPHVRTWMRDSYECVTHMITVLIRISHELSVSQGTISIFNRETVPQEYLADRKFPSCDKMNASLICMCHSFEHDTLMNFSQTFCLSRYNFYLQSRDSPSRDRNFSCLSRIFRGWKSFTHINASIHMNASHIWMRDSYDFVPNFLFFEIQLLPAIERQSSLEHKFQLSLSTFSRVKSFTHMNASLKKNA